MKKQGPFSTNAPRNNWLSRRHLIRGVAGAARRPHKFITPLSTSRVHSSALEPRSDGPSRTWLPLPIGGATPYAKLGFRARTRAERRLLRIG